MMTVMTDTEASSVVMKRWVHHPLASWLSNKMQACESREQCQYIVRTQDVVMAAVAVPRQQRLPLPLLSLHPVALPHPGTVTVEQITIFLRLSFVLCFFFFFLQNDDPALAGVAHLVRASSSTLKGHWFDSRSGHILRLKVCSLVDIWTATNQCFSLRWIFPSPFLSL